MSYVLLDANAVIMHGRAFPDRVRAAVDRGETVVLPHAVEQELVDDVLESEDSPPNHRDSARTVRELIEEGYLTVREPNFDAYSDVIDEARRRIADESLPEHAVKADRYIPALVCELAHDDTVYFVTADRKLRRLVRDIVERRDLSDAVTIDQPRSVL